MPDTVVRGPAGAWPPPFSQAFLDQALTLLDARPVLVIVGPVGAGRQRLADQIARLAAADGPAPLRHAARHVEHDRPYSTLHHLLPGLTLAPDAPLAVAETAAREALSRLGSRSVVVLADTDLCDPQSVATLAQVAGTDDVRLIATLAPETAAGQEPLLSVAEVLDLPPLTHEGIGALLRSRFGVRAHPLLVSLLAERTDRSYAALRSVADASFAAGLIFEVEGVLACHPSMTTEAFESHHAPQVIERLGGGPHLTNLVQLIALLGQLDVDEARTCVSSDVVDLTLTHGASTLRDGGLVLVSRAEQAQLCSAMSDDRRRELFEEFADRLPRTLGRPGVAARAADWWIIAGRRLPVDLAVRAAREANLAGRHYRAVLYTEPSSNDQQADVALLERSFAVGEVGQKERLTELCARLDPTTLDEDELLAYLCGLVHLDDPRERERMTARALVVADPAARRRRAAVRTLADLVVLGFDSSGDESINRLRSLTFSSQLSPANRATTFATLSAALRHAGRPVEAVEAVEFALGILHDEGDGVSAFHLNLAREHHIMALISAVDLDGAERAIAACATGPSGHTIRRPMVTALETSLAMHQGDLERALSSARLCLAGLEPDDPHQIRGWVEAMLAQILVLRGRPAEAQTVLLAAEKHPVGVRQLDLERRMKLAWTHDALAEPEEALGLLADATLEARKYGLRLALIDGAALSVQIGGPPHLAMLLGAVDDLVDPSGVPLVWQTFARSADRGDLSSLIALADLAEAGGARRFAAEVAQYILDTWRRRSDFDAETKEHLQQLADPGPSHRVDQIS